MHLIRNISVSLLLVGIVLFIFRKGLRSKLYVAGIFLLSIIMTLIYTLTGITPMSGFHLDVYWDRINLIPFKGIAEMMSEGLSQHAIRNICGNILMFAPIGIILPLLDKRNRGVMKILITGAMISLMIELWQLFLIRGTDIDDIILNTLGTILGYGCFHLFYGLFPDFCRKFRIRDKVRTKATVICSVIVPALVIIILGFYDRLMYMNS